MLRAYRVQGNETSRGPPSSEQLPRLPEFERSRARSDTRSHVELTGGGKVLCDKNSTIVPALAPKLATPVSQAHAFGTLLTSDFDPALAE